MSRPLAIDLFCGLGGWTDGLLAEGYDVVGFDIERHQYGDHRYPAQLVVQDVTTLHGSQFRSAALIVASPPCQEYSYMAMPWSLAKAKAAAIRADKTGAELERLNRLFNSTFRIQREAIEAAGRHIPLVVENVRGAIPWVGRSRWNFGSFHLWGDIPALMPITSQYGQGPGVKRPGRTMCFPAGSANPDAVSGRNGKLHWQDEAGMKVPGFRFDGSGKSFQSASVEFTGTKVPSEEGRHTDLGKGARFTSRDCGIEGHKGGGDWFGSGDNASLQRRHGSKSPGRKMASAMIAKIPLPLSRHIAATFHPGNDEGPFDFQAARRAADDREIVAEMEGQR